MSACLFPVRGWKGKIVMSSEEYVSSITAAVAGSLCSQWLLMKSGGAWIRDGSEFLIMPPLVNWIFGGGGRRTGGEKNVIANLFSTALWTWCHSTKLITLRWLFVSNEILLKKCGCRIKKPRNVKSLHPGGGGTVIITPDTRRCAKLMTWLLREWESRIRSVDCPGTDGHRSRQPQINVSTPRSDLSEHCTEGEN